MEQLALKFAKDVNSRIGLFVNLLVVIVNILILVLELLFILIPVLKLLFSNLKVSLKNITNYHSKVAVKTM